MDESDTRKVRRTLSRPEWFIERLRALPRSDDRKIWGLCAAELRWLKTTPMQPTASKPPQIGYTLTSLRSVLRDYRNAIREAFDEKHPALYYLRASIDDQEAYKESYNAQIVTANTSRRPIDAEWLVDRAIAVLSAPMESPPFAIAAAIAMVTGRRGWEIARTEGIFSPAPQKPAYLAGAGDQVVTFSGQAKTREADTAQTGPYEIPILCEPTILFTAFRAMKERYDFDAIRTDKQFNGHARKEINTFATRLFTDATVFQKGLTLKSLRSAYSAIAFSWFAGRGMSPNAFAGRILGHSDLDIVTAQSYDNFFLIGEEAPTARQRREGVLSTIADLEQLRDAEPDEILRDLYEERIEIARASLERRDPTPADGLEEPDIRPGM